VKDQAAIAVHSLYNVCGRPQARDNNRHLVPYAHLQVRLQAFVTCVNDLIDSVGRDELGRVCCSIVRQRCLDLHNPFFKVILRPGIQRRKRTDNAGSALSDDQFRTGNDEHRRTDQRNAQTVLQ